MDSIARNRLGNNTTYDIKKLPYIIVKVGFGNLISRIGVNSKDVVSIRDICDINPLTILKMD